MNNVKELKYGNTKTYLINNKVLIDTDWNGTLYNFFKCMKQENLEVNDIKYLIITHFHPDHMGIAQELAELGIKIVVFEEQKSYIHSSDKIFANKKNTLFKPIDETKIIIISCLKSRDFFKKVGINGEVIHTPGHSEDSISILLDNGIAIVGDLCPFHYAQAYNNKELEQSWNNILSHHVHLIYYSHEKEDYIENITSLNDYNMT